MVAKTDFTSQLEKKATEEDLIFLKVIVVHLDSPRVSLSPLQSQAFAEVSASTNGGNACAKSIGKLALVNSRGTVMSQ